MLDLDNEDVKGHKESFYKYIVIHYISVKERIFIPTDELFYFVTENILVDSGSRWAHPWRSRNPSRRRSRWTPSSQSISQVNNHFNHFVSPRTIAYKNQNANRRFIMNKKLS